MFLQLYSFDFITIRMTFDKPLIIIDNTAHAHAQWHWPIMHQSSSTALVQPELVASDVDHGRPGELTIPRLLSSKNSGLRNVTRSPTTTIMNIRNIMIIMTIVTNMTCVKTWTKLRRAQYGYSKEKTYLGRDTRIISKIVKISSVRGEKLQKFTNSSQFVLSATFE